ncbi:S46 family peptidase [Mariniblastus fucicola]|uniref:Dipeptidyl-peptidase n=1 Tax=Mariniblastus fucicola TaxID=980251 RepID=A0A5B9P837_9BACT|nr:S46 family peptidase [Mariniblastus fucicola]QEG22494.1 Peptidase S46 [Mariniblastus fucicola]
MFAIFKRCCLLSLLVAGLCNSTLSQANADEGMWLFNDLPTEHLKSKYGFEPTEEWSDKLMKSCVRFNVGGSASFVSSNGLVLTNHHVAFDTLSKLSDKDNNYAKDGFLAKSMADELKAPDLELNQLIKITDVTDKVNEAISSDMAPGDAAKARRARIGEIESAAKEESGLRSDVVTLYGGGKYHLYQYKKYTDVRLVWAPEASIAFFGGDADNFEYPRFNLDATIFRVYEDDKPAKIEHFLKWSEDGPAENELVFVAGNPGRTSRIFTTAALKYQRDVRMPYILDFIRRREVLLQQFGLGGPEMERIAKDQLFGFQNSRKAYMGMLQGLQDPAMMANAVAAEQKLLEKVSSTEELKEYASAWEKIADVQKRKAKKQGQGVLINSRMFSIAQELVQMATEDLKPSNERLAEFQDSGRESLEQQLFSSAPIYKELQQAILADEIARMCEIRGADDELCQTVLAGKNPNDRASELIFNSKLDDPEVRQQIAAGGIDAIKNSDDPLIKLAVAVDDKVRADRKDSEELGEIEKQAYAQISQVMFAANGTSVYPDATFTLRLAFGPVIGYEEKGKSIPAFTDINGTFAHEESHSGQKDFDLPESWTSARDKIPGGTRMNFVCTTDIIGGNSGSPVVNKDLELVGLIFDGNIQSLIADYAYTDKQGRSVSVHSNAIRESLRYVYDAEFLADQLGK